ncbi:hypothetical protein T07_8849 [Trichinella nelsoni]|uniref:Uncharacterized protein n=1 Tax=Trichinella nelsoni TaxID=6336 RepID=A0A0V0S9S0_9BILA|nr:hypothetical protein T07_8849 [Trichinella nelsoni]
MLSSHHRRFTLCEDAFCTVQGTTQNTSPWQDKVQRSFSLRNHRIILSSQCEDAFFTSWTLHPEITGSFYLLSVRMLSSHPGRFTLCEDAFFTSWTLHPGRIKWNGYSV